MSIAGQQETFSDDTTDELEHYGIKRRSGRYPWGSGEDPYQSSGGFLSRYHELRKAGFTDAEIAKTFTGEWNQGQVTSDQVRAWRTIAVAERRAELSSQAWKLKEKGWSNVAIGKKLGTPDEPIRESTVRSLLNPHSQARTEATLKLADSLKATIPKDGAVDIGKGTELFLGVSADKMKVATAMLEAEGYTVHNLYVEQLGVKGQKTTVQVLAAPGVTTRDLYNNKTKVTSIAKSDRENKKAGNLGIQTPVSLDPKRVKVRYSEDGGELKDGVMEINPKAADLRMGNNKYAQVRISVDSTHYLKGMAVYGDPKDFPPGVDVIFNTNKHKGTPMLGSKDNTVLKVLKSDKDNPFGATIRQFDYVDPKTGKKKQSAINIVNDEGSWDDWSRNLPSQVLSKQDVSLAKKQLGLAYDRYKADYDQISRLTNPVVKKKMLQEFADQVDAASVHMKGAAMPRQRTRVILPVKSLKDNEIFAPHLKDGEEVVLVRFPHAGQFEIPSLVVNNRNREARRVIGTDSKDAVGINAKVASILSGADFDGDTVLVIPNNKHEFKKKDPLPGLKGFNPSEAYPKYPGMKVISSRDKQMEMGKVSNLITDMTIRGATSAELTRAVRHSMVVIDSEKHELDYKTSEVDNGIAALKKKYQGGSKAGASTLISRATSDQMVDERTLRKARDGGPIDPKTGEKVYTYTGSSYDKVAYQKLSGTKKDGSPRYKKEWVTESKFNALKKSGELPTSTKIVDRQTIRRQMKSTKMAEAKDAFSLSSGTPMEAVYATHANRLKALANEARKEQLAVGTFKYDPAARKEYATEVASLTAKLNKAKKNYPLERKAQILANQQYEAKKEANPGLDDDQLKRLKSQCLKGARDQVGSSKKDVQIHITDREWEAIQHRAVSAHTLEQILQDTDPDVIRKLATPKETETASAAQLSKARQLIARGYTLEEVSEAIGLSTSTISAGLK